LISSGVRNGIGKRRHFPYAPLEALFLATLLELNPADLDSKDDPVAPLEGKLAEIDTWIAKVQARLDDEGPTEELLNTLDRYSKRRKAIADELEAARLATVKPSTLADAQGLAAKIKDPDARRNLKAKIRLLVDSIWLLITDASPTERYAHLQVYFKSGTVRCLMAYWKRKGRGRGHVLPFYCGEGEVSEMPHPDLREYRTTPRVAAWFKRWGE
jgi:hypothetical protein